MMQFKDYVKVKTLEEAYELNQKKTSVILGGMHWLKMSNKSAGTAIDLSGLGLNEIIETEDAFEIGAMVSLRQLETNEGLKQYTGGAVRDALKDIVGVQFRNTATVGGSIFGRYGFSDVLTIFLAMNTTVVCHKAGEISLEDFSQMKQDRDILVKLIVKKENIKISYQALRRTRTDFPVLACAVSNTTGKYRAIVSARPYKAAIIFDDLNLLAPCSVTEEAARSFGKYVSENVDFGSNMRGSAEYRKQIAAVLVKRAIMEAEKEVK